MFKSTPKILIFIFFLALLLRVIKLESFPVGFHSDEARVAWNAISILKTGKDDRGNSFSLYYDTFGDFRPTGIFYSAIPSILFFGRTEFAVRLPSALFGALTIFPLYFLVLEIGRKNSKLALLSGFLLAISPWHIEVSRATSEMVISTFFALSALYFLIKIIKTGRLRYFFLSCLSIGISYFLYHAIRFLAPPFFLIIIIFFLKEIKKNGNKKLTIGLFAFVSLLTIFFSTTGEAKKRFDQVSIFNDNNTTYEIERLKNENKNSNLIFRFIDNRYFVYARRFLIEYPTYFSNSFLTGNSAKPYRYATPGAGLITYIEFMLFILGIIQIIRKKNSVLPLVFLLIAPLPAAITTEDAPNLHRAFLMLPFLIIIEAYGLEAFSRFKKYQFQIKTGTYTLLIINFIFFLYMYFNHSFSHKPFIENYPLDGSSYRNVGAKKLSLEIEKIKDNYDKIIVTNSPDDPYPWYAFFTGKDPKYFNEFSINRKDGPWQYQEILFSQSKCPSDTYFKTDRANRLLVIDAEDPVCDYEAQIKDGLKAKVVNKILRPDGTEVYVFLEKK